MGITWYNLNDNGRFSLNFVEISVKGAKNERKINCVSCHDYAFAI